MLEKKALIEVEIILVKLINNRKGCCIVVDSILNFLCISSKKYAFNRIINRKLTNLHVEQILHESAPTRHFSFDTLDFCSNKTINQNLKL